MGGSLENEDPVSFTLTSLPFISSAPWTWVFTCVNQTIPKDKHWRKIVLHSVDFQHPYSSQGRAIVLLGVIHGSRQLAWTEIGSDAVPVPQLQTRKLTETK